MTAAVAHAQELLEATAPPEHRGLARDAVRMLVTDVAARTHAHARFSELASFLRAGDLLVANDSATLPAALPAMRANGDPLALHVATKIDARVWLAEPRGLVLLGEELRLPHGGSAVMIAPVDPERARLWYAWFQLPLPMEAYLMQTGEPIRYSHVAQSLPLSDFQTMFACTPGSSEMPSAARPFTPRVLAALRQRGIAHATVTLHCGVSSLEAPERPAIERFSVSHETAERVNGAKREGRRVIAIGTTVLRALESAVHNGVVVAASGWTDLVVDEHHRVKTADGLLTGFHDSTATHLWVLRAFLDHDLLRSAYETAARGAYFRHEFGDVHLIV
jgi:S-adenosylmethionine:tRNA ribosyltransferase-isomerase